MQRQKPALVRQQKGLQRSLGEVNAEAGKLLREWSSSEGGEGKAFVTERLNGLAQRREEIERELLEIAQKLAQVQEGTVSAEVVREALTRVREVWEHLKPYERQELMRLVVNRAEVGVSEMVLEIKGGVLPMMAQTPQTTSPGTMVRQIQEWLPELVSQSVLRRACAARLKSVRRWARRRDAAQQRAHDRKSFWQSLLDAGLVPTHAALARLQGLSRARITQVLAPAAS